jgi:2-(1,2-epoxy-1,2-dihydrophenyl)acetyl-CoA isomerase
MMQQGTFQGFDVEVHDPGIALITFNEPDRMNGMTMSLKRDLVETLTQAQMDESIRVVVFTGSGKAFSAGDDISGHAAGGGEGKTLVPKIPQGFSTAKNHAMGTYDGLRALSQALNVAVRNLDKLSIAAINGYAIQTGFSLALSCDFRIAAKDAKIGSATLRFGLQPDEGGQYLLVQMMGVAKTMDFLMRKRIVTGEEALDLGLVHEVVEPDLLLECAMDLAREMANGPQVAMRLLKRSIYNAADMTWEHSLDDIAAKTAISDLQPDAQEGVAAFREKRTPKFNQWLK